MLIIDEFRGFEEASTGLLAGFVAKCGFTCPEILKVRRSRFSFMLKFGCIRQKTKRLPMLKNCGRISFCITVGWLFLSLSGCAIHAAATSLSPGLAAGQLCIHENPQVIIGDFLPTVESAARRHGFEVRVYRKIPESCRVVIEYDGHQKWDFTNFMNKAEIKVFDRGVMVAEASYSTSNGVFGGGGLNGEKWRSTKFKLDPLLDRIFSNYPLRAEE